MRLLLGGELGALLVAKLDRRAKDRTLASSGAVAGSTAPIPLGPPASLGSRSRPSVIPTGIFRIGSGGTGREGSQSDKP